MDLIIDGSDELPTAPAPKKIKKKAAKPKAKKPTPKKAKAKKPGPKTYNGELTHRFDMRVTAKDRKKLEAVAKRKGQTITGVVLALIQKLK